MPIVDDLRGAARLASEFGESSVAFFASTMRDLADRSRYEQYCCIAVRSLPSPWKRSWHEVATRLDFVERLAVVGLAVSAASAWAIARQLPLLGSIEISATDLGDQGGADLIDALHDPTRITDLAIDNAGITGASFVSLGTKLPALRRLSVANNGLGDGDATRIAEQANKLTHLDVRENWITDVGLDTLRQGLPNLVELRY